MRLLVATLLFSAVFAALDLLALHYALYWILPWLDTFMHFFGGIIVALLLLIAALKLGLPIRLLPVFLLAILVGGLWEWFEFLAGTTREANYAFDTSLDLLMDALGALAGYRIGMHFIWKRH